MSPTQQAVVDKIYNAFQDEKIVREIKKTGFSASALGWASGKCPRRWYFAFKGTEGEEMFSSYSRKNMANGTAMHEAIQEILSKDPDLNILIEEEIWHENPPLHGFIDGVITADDGEEILLEIKSANDLAFAYRQTKFESASYHKLQLLIYLKVKGKTLGLFLYENKNDYDDVLIPLFMDEENQKYIDYVFDWMREVYAEFEKDVVPDFFSGKRSNSKICKECPFFTACHDLGEVSAGKKIELLVLP